MEQWLFHKLNVASAAVNDNLEARDFAEASNAAYSFFLHDLCDVFIEATKPLFETNTESGEKVSAQNTLYTCLEGGLKLLHPFMPYVTEDLWQRLPRRPEDTCESIMISAFPESVSFCLPYESRRRADIAKCRFPSKTSLRPKPTLT